MDSRVEKLACTTRRYMDSPRGARRAFELKHGKGCSYRRLLAFMAMEATKEERYETICAVVDTMADAVVEA